VVQSILTTRQPGAVNRNHFNSDVWKKALQEAGLPTARDNGTHALRHHDARVLLDGGESIMGVTEHLGHAAPGFTLRTDTHVMRSSDEWTCQAVEDAFGRCMTDTSALQRAPIQPLTCADAATRTS
jgi:integrase